MPSLNTPGHLKRPHILNAGGSSSSSLYPDSRIDRSPSPSPSAYSLRGLEQVPSFQSFIRHTPIVRSGSEKPLPPTPQPCEEPFESASGASVSRSSSVYSQSSSLLPSQTPPWHSQDPEVELAPFLRPMAYSASTPDLSSSGVSTPLLLEPRTFSPLIESPRATTVASSSPPQTRPHSMLASISIANHVLSASSRMDLETNRSKVPPPISTQAPPPLHAGARRPVKTVSLEQANAEMNAPGAPRLLPEELREQALKNCSAQGHVRMDSLDMFGGVHRTPLPPAIPTRIDRQTREGSLQTTEQPTHPRTNPAYNSYPVGTGPAREMAPPQIDSGGGTMTANMQPDREGVEEARRGRTPDRKSSKRCAREQASVMIGHTPHHQKRKTQSEILTPEYDSLLSQQQNTYRHGSESPAGYSSDENIGAQMKMVPQPLFQGKQPPMSRRSEGARISGSSISPFNMHRRGRSHDSTSSGSQSTGNMSTSFGLRISPENPDPKGRNSSTTGMIPISPPTNIRAQRLQPSHMNDALYQPNPRKFAAKSYGRQNSRESSFYPHIMQRKSSKKKDAITELPIVTDATAEKQETPQPKLIVSAILSHANKTSRKTPTAAESERKRKRFYQRFGRTRRRSSNKSFGSAPDRDAASQASPSSPHLHPSPVKTHDVHLGWSETAKKTFDDAQTRVTHIAAPARPLDLSKASLTEPGTPSSPTSPRRPSLLGGVFHSWRENKAEKRREDLKKLIRVVPVAEGAGSDKPALKRSSTLTAGATPNALPRRLSASGWM